MKILITGAAGFIGAHLYELIARNEPRAIHTHTNDFKRIIDQSVVG